LRSLGVGLDREGLRPGRARRLRRRAHLALHPEGTARRLRAPRLYPRGDALHPSRRADPGVSQAGAMTGTARSGGGPIRLLAWALVILPALILLAYVAIYAVNGAEWDHLPFAEIFDRWNRGQFTL